MKNSFNMVLTILFLAILGCSCPKLSDLAKRSENAPAPPAATPYSPPATPLPAPSSASSNITLAKYNQVQTNMARADVERIFGGPGTKVSTSTGGGVTYEVRKWQNEDYTAAILTFRNDKVNSKTQVGLK